MEYLTRLRFTALFLGLMIAANWAAGTLNGTLPLAALRAWGVSHQSIVNGEAFRLITGTFLSHDAGMFARQCVFAVTVIGYYEWRQGSLRAFLMFLVTDIIGTLSVLFAVIPLLSALPEFSAPVLHRTLDVGMSAGGFGLVGAGFWCQRWRRVLLGAALAAIWVKMAMDFDIIADSAHMTCLFLGAAAQAMMDRVAVRRRDCGAHG